MVLTGKIIPLLVNFALGSYTWRHCWFIRGGGTRVLTNPKGTPSGVSKRLPSSGP